jgi:galactokinase
VNYVATVARRVHRNFSSGAELRGADVAFLSDLSIAAGMSSSSALMVATFLAVRAVNRLEAAEPYRREIRSDIQLAEYLGCTENGQSYGSLTGEAGVGTFGGSEDHTAMLCCKAGMLSQFSYAPSVWERDIPFPDGLSLIVAASGVQAVKTAEAMEQYNRASLRARKATAAYNRATGSRCRHFREIAEAVGPAGLVEALEAIARGAAADEGDLDLPGRFECFFREDQQIIPAVGDALLAGRSEPLGELFDASHAGARLGLRNQIPETDFLQASARQLGAVAASAFGAGFGGSVLALVPAEQADAFTDAWRTRYLRTYPRHAERAEFFQARPGRAADVTAP